MSLRTSDEVRPWARSIRQKVSTRQMPPWFADPAHGSFANDARLNQQQIDTIVKWGDAGAPQGNPADTPQVPTYSDGWQLGEPDYVITLPRIEIPAEGKDIFPTPNPTIDIPDDRWVRAVEIRPSAREVTHHTVLSWGAAWAAAWSARPSGTRRHRRSRAERALHVRGEGYGDGTRHYGPGDPGGRRESALQPHIRGHARAEHPPGSELAQLSRDG
jgi:hypothetical protein